MSSPENLGGRTGASGVTSRDTAADTAAAQARTAAAAAGVEVRALSDFGDLDQAVRLFARIWGRDANPPMNLELLRAFGKAGNYVSGAFADDRLVGACAGFFHAPSEDALHSHIAGVSPEMTGRAVGFALKLHQRAWAMDRGVDRIAWTYDPLVARNAYFNVVKLAARPVEYMPNFYGLMLDPVNGDGDSDRLLVRWSLRDPAVARACERPGEVRADPALAAGAVVALGTAADGSPEPGRLGGTTSLVAVPRDITGLRAAAPALAGRWRRAVRDTMTDLMARGATVVGFDRTRGYVLRRNS
ncbi:GNAT family N-acetyltransferase [Actinoplanes auranticolor]|nr:GNAT family N-acetyltransferase [Actinoplanes auranticolor]